MQIKVTYKACIQCILCLLCNAKKSKITAKFSEKNRNKCQCHWWPLSHPHFVTISSTRIMHQKSYVYWSEIVYNNNLFSQCNCMLKINSTGAGSTYLHHFWGKSILIWTSEHILKIKRNSNVKMSRCR